MLPPEITPASFRAFLQAIPCDPGDNVLACYEELAAAHGFDLPAFAAQAGKDANSLQAESLTPRTRHATAYSILKGQITFHLTQVLHLSFLPYLP